MSFNPNARFAALGSKLTVRLVPLALGIVAWCGSGPVVALGAESNLQPGHAAAWGANIGWTDWRPNSVHGAQIGEFVCSGFIYGANVGWIHLGDGTPKNGVQYQNNSADDYGVNHDQLGNLRGFAYGANIGWIEFSETGAPRVDLQTGQLSGAIYGANVGWITLSGSGFMLKIESLAPGLDSDQDSIPDSWEIAAAGNLSRLRANGDADFDGTTDDAEYLADTNPLSRADQLRIVEFVPMGSNWALAWPTKPTRDYVIQAASRLDQVTPWESLPLGRQPGTGNLMRTVVSGDANAPELFFRVEAVRRLTATE